MKDIRISISMPPNKIREASRTDPEDWITSPVLGIKDINSHPLRRKHSDYALLKERRSRKK